MAIDIYLNFNGNCREAVEFYADVFNTEKPLIKTFADAPQQPGQEAFFPAEANNLILHASLMIKGTKVMFSDILPGMTFTPGNNMSLSIDLTDLEEMKTIFSKLSEGGKVDMELQETFWSECYGSLIDKFGIIWSFNYNLF